MTEEQIREKALEYVMRTDDKNDTIGDRMNRIEDFVAGAHILDEEIRKLEENVDCLQTAYDAETDCLNDKIAELREEIDKLRNSWITVARQLPERITASNGALMDMSEQVIVKDLWGKKWIAQYDYRYKRWWGEEQVVVDVVSWMKIPD